MAILRGQKGNNDCGPTCFANALNILGYDIKIAQSNDLCSLRYEGTDSFDLIRAFERYGFDVKEKIHYDADRAWNWLMKETSKGAPTILSVDGDSHWILALRTGKTQIQIFDPDDDFPKKINKSAMLDRWACYGDKRTRPRFHALEMVPFKIKSIKAVVLREQLLSTADVR